MRWTEELPEGGMNGVVTGLLVCAGRLMCAEYWERGRVGSTEELPKGGIDGVVTELTVCAERWEGGRIDGGGARQSTTSTSL